jgi:hypothetical protein
MKMVLPDPFVVHVIIASLPKEFEAFVVHYNMAPEDWNIEKLLGQATQEEERLKESRGDSALFVKHNNNKKFYHKNAKPQGKPKWDGSSSSNAQASNSQGKAPQNPQTAQNNNGAQDQNRP